MTSVKEKVKKKLINTHSIGRNIFNMTIIFSLILGLGMGSVGFGIYCWGMKTNYENYLSGVLRYLHDAIPGEDLKNYVEAGVETEEYQQAEATFDYFINTYDQLEDLYIIQPVNTEESDNQRYIVANTSKGARLGALSGEEFHSKAAKHFMAQMQEKEAVNFFFNNTERGMLYTGMVTILDSAGEPVAILASDISLTQMVHVLMRAQRFVLLGSIFFICVFLFVQMRWMKLRIIHPIEKLKEAAVTFVEKNHQHDNPEEISFEKPQMPREDEMDSLAECIYTMAEDTRLIMLDFLQESLDKERISSELTMATQIQANMLPNLFPAFPERPEFDIFASMTPAKEVGGDFYDFFLVDDDHLALVMADVSGKGVPAALFMMGAKILLKNSALYGHSPKSILEKVNNQLCENNQAEMFVTVWIGIYEISTGKLTAANAGHEYPAICRAGGSFELYKDKHDFVLGAMEDLPYNEYELQLYPGDTLFVYTDGVAEATNVSEELMGTERMLEALNRRKDATPREMLEGILEDVRTFTGEAPQFDDVTMLALKIIEHTNESV